jgi:hypothetical protein
MGIWKKLRSDRTTNLRNYHSWGAGSRELGCLDINQHVGVWPNQMSTSGKYTNYVGDGRFANRGLRFYKVRYSTIHSAGLNRENHQTSDR